MLEARADVLVAAIPIHNFGVPSGFKAWMDQLARPGVTFNPGGGAVRAALGQARAGDLGVGGRPALAGA